MRETSETCRSEKRGPADPTVVHGHLCAGQGIGNILSGPLSDSLIKGLPWQGKAMGGCGSGHAVLILYTGVTGILSGMGFLWKRMKLV